MPVSQSTLAPFFSRRGSDRCPRYLTPTLARICMVSSWTRSFSSSVRNSAVNFIGPRPAVLAFGGALSALQALELGIGSLVKRQRLVLLKDVAGDILDL